MDKVEHTLDIVENLSVWAFKDSYFPFYNLPLYVVDYVAVISFYAKLLK